MDGSENVAPARRKRLDPPPDLIADLCGRTERQSLLRVHAPAPKSQGVTVAFLEHLRLHAGRRTLDRIQDIEELKKSTAVLQAECVRLDADSRTHIQKLGVVRFNAFDNTGSDLSFSVALLDAADAGFVLSGIYGREESRVYAKPVLKGESTYLLTKEEKQALDAARKK